MNIQQQINEYISSQSEAKGMDMRTLHSLIMKLRPACKLWFLDGKNIEGKVVTNPNIGYGNYTMQYADGTTRDFYQIGMSANSSGISVYILGLADKNYLKETYAQTLGKASIRGYCIKFKSLKDIQLAVLEAAIRDGFEAHEK
jgi:hypothetical protein